MQNRFKLNIINIFGSHFVNCTFILSSMELMKIEVFVAENYIQLNINKTSCKQSFFIGIVFKLDFSCDVLDELESIVIHF
jgi:hypothetical protein